MREMPNCEMGTKNRKCRSGDRPSCSKLRFCNKNITTNIDYTDLSLQTKTKIPKGTETAMPRCHRSCYHFGIQTSRLDRTNKDQIEEFLGAEHKYIINKQGQQVNKKHQNTCHIFSWFCRLVNTTFLKSTTLY